MSHRRYLVCYDICDPVRLRRVAKTMEGFGTRIQYSVFECVLNETSVEQAKALLSREMNFAEDQVLFVSLGPESSDTSLMIESLGLPYELRSRVTIV